jgi:AcrR family transcriptional regulator
MIAVIAGGDEDRGRDVREEMTRSAAVLFGERGFSGTGLRDVIAHSATPRGSIYHHFAGGKAELAREAVRHAAGAVAGPVGDAARGGDPIATLHAWLDHWRDALERSDFRAGSAVLAVAAEPEEQTGARAAAAAAYEGWADTFAATLHGAGVRRKKAARLATLTVAAIEGAVVVSRARGDTRALDHVGRELEAAIDAARAS